MSTISSSSEERRRPKPMVEIHIMEEDMPTPTGPPDTHSSRSRTRSEKSGTHSETSDSVRSGPYSERHDTRSAMSGYSGTPQPDANKNSFLDLVSMASEESDPDQDNKDKNSDLPRHWTRLNSEYPYVLIRMDNKKGGFIRLRNQFVSGGGPDTVSEVFRIQSPDVYRRYEHTKKILTSLAYGTYRPQTEQTLYYGCNRYDLDTVCRLGFTKSLHKKTKYGKGVPFWKRPGYAAHKHCPRFCTGNRFLVVCKVLTGNTTMGYKTMKNPGVDGTGHEFQSAVDKKNNPTNFIIFSEDQVYPEYIIVF